jgi:hypothetical protein
MMFARTAFDRSFHRANAVNVVNVVKVFSQSSPIERLAVLFPRVVPPLAVACDQRPRRGSRAESDDSDVPRREVATSYWAARISVRISARTLSGSLSQHLVTRANPGSSSADSAKTAPEFAALESAV